MKVIASSLVRTVLRGEHTFYRCVILLFERLHLLAVILFLVLPLGPVVVVALGPPVGGEDGHPDVGVQGGDLQLVFKGRRSELGTCSKNKIKI